MEKYMNEKDVIKYLNKTKDNVLIVFGHTTYFTKRSILRKMFKDPVYCFTGDDAKRYYQIINRPLISENDMKNMLDKNYCIYNVHVLVNVLKVFNDIDPQNIHMRSVYEIENYTLEDYMSI